MSFFKADSDKVKKDASGILYLLDMVIDGEQCVKIGVTQRKIEERVVEILASVFKGSRYFPYCRPKRFKKTESVYAKEAMMHRYFADRKCVIEKRFDGSTEMFNVDLDEVVEVYERCIAGEDINKREELEDAEEV